MYIVTSDLDGMCMYMYNARFTCCFSPDVCMFSFLTIIQFGKQLFQCPLATAHTPGSSLNKKWQHVHVHHQSQQTSPVLSYFLKQIGTFQSARRRYYFKTYF